MQEQLAKLINVKSIITILLCITFMVLALSHVIGGNEFLTVFTVVISFYFGTQYEKRSP